MPRTEVDILLDLLDGAYQRPTPDDWHHILYHSGEIDHIRALHQENDG